MVNIAYLVVRPSATGRLAIDRNTGKDHTRYDHPVLTASTLDKAFRALRGLEVFTVSRGRSGLATSTLEPTPAFAEGVVRYGVTATDFGRDPLEEVIVLSVTGKRLVNTKHGWDWKKRSKFINYKDTHPDIGTLRSRLYALNAYVSEADIDFVDDGLEPVAYADNRVMRRRFTLLHANDDPTWDLNGRLCGGFWQNLERSRRGGIRIDGEPVCDLDFKNAFARLAYLHVGVEPPPGDLYDLTAILRGYDDRHPTHRDGVKQGFNALLFGGKAQSSEIVAQLPEGTTARGLRGALANKHPALVPVFGSKLGYTLMYRESCILMRTLELLMAQGVVGLGMHDGLMVARSHEDAARKAMEAACVEVVGVPLRVDEKDVYVLPEVTGELLAA